MQCNTLRRCNCINAIASMEFHPCADTIASMQLHQCNGVNAMQTIQSHRATIDKRTSSIPIQPSHHHHSNIITCPSAQSPLQCNPQLDMAKDPCFDDRGGLMNPRTEESCRLQSILKDACSRRRVWPRALGAARGSRPPPPQGSRSRRTCPPTARRRPRSPALRTAG